MPEPMPIDKLNLGVNFRGFLGSVTMRPGEAQDCLDILPREDGGVYKTVGWLRRNYTALSGVPLACSGFSYRGKNVDTAGGNTARAGNYALAETGAVFTKRTDVFSGFVVLTSTTFYFWNHATQAFATVALPGGAAVEPGPKPSIVVFKDNLYIVGWATKNLRYDPTDRRLYLWGWESVPAAPGAALAAGGTLVASAKYKYAYSYFDVYTGEETAMGAISEATTTAANRTVNLTFVAYSGSRHFNDLAAATDSDVGIVVYRTNEDDDAYYFLTTLNPGTTSLSDTGLSTATSTRPFQGTMQDEPRFSALEAFGGRMWALSRASNSNRLYFSDFTTAPFVERFRVRSYKDLIVPEGDALTAIGKTDTSLLVFTRKGCFRVSIIEGTSTPQILPSRLPWDVGAVGPRARLTVRGWEYFLSERGPYRWREGLLDPQFIGENVGPMFMDPMTSLCRLNEAAKEQTELALEPISDTVRWVFPVGTAPRPNTHLAYWIEADRLHQDPRYGWFPQSVQAQCFDQTVSLGGLDTNGRPPSGNEKRERLAFADADGYVYEYVLGQRRGGLPPGALAKGFAAAGSTVALMQVQGGLFTEGDGCKGLRVEVLHLATNTTEIRTILSNTDTTVTPTTDFTTAAAASDIFWIGGMPAFWRSWADHMGDPQAEKTIVNFYFGFMRTGSDEVGDFNEFLMDVSVGGSNAPFGLTRYRTAKLSKWRSGFLVNLTKRFFVYEFANSKPDETFLVTNFQREVEPVAAKRALG